MKTSRLAAAQQASAVAVVVLSLGLPGCGNGLARVTGSVSLDGEPVRGGGDVRATVFFTPVAGGSASVGLVDESGAYELRTGSEAGVAPGDYAVTFTATEKIVPKDGGTPAGRRISPPRYAAPSTSGLEFTVEPGSNTIDLALTSAG